MSRVAHRSIRRSAHRSTGRRLPLLVLLALLASLLAGCTVNGSVQETEEERQSFPVGTAPRVIVDSFNGRISVVSGADGVVEARVNKRGSGTSSETAKEDLANVIVAFDRVGDRITITARRADTGRIIGNSGADVDVTVPAASSVELRTQNGRVEAANVEGKIIVRTSNGPITTRGGRDLDLDTTNGQISVNNPSGHLSLRTSNGGIDILAGKDVSVVAETSNDPITFSGTLGVGAHSFTTTNGDIDITLPGDFGFTFDGQTSNGSVRTEFGDLKVSDTSIAGHTGKDPTPEVTVIARTSNGDLAVMTQKP